MIRYHELTKMWAEAGGRFHGPDIETGTMPENTLLPFLQALVGPDQQLKDVEERVLALRLGPVPNVPPAPAMAPPAPAMAPPAPAMAPPAPALSPASVWPFATGNVDDLERRGKVESPRATKLSPQAAWPFPINRKEDTK